eukprot:6995068-Prymnesium_polylepis.1
MNKYRDTGNADSRNKVYTRRPSAQPGSSPFTRRITWNQRAVWSRDQSASAAHSAIVMAAAR